MKQLLGRDQAHWSFFLDSDASVMEGNDIEDKGGGRFETVGIAHGFSALDQYGMGLRAAAEVPPFFYVEAPDDFRPNRPYKAGTGQPPTRGKTAPYANPDSPPHTNMCFTHAWAEGRPETSAYQRSRFASPAGRASRALGIMSMAMSAVISAIVKRSPATKARLPNS